MLAKGGLLSRDRSGSAQKQASVQVQRPVRSARMMCSQVSGVPGLTPLPEKVLTRIVSGGTEDGSVSVGRGGGVSYRPDRKSTRLNSSHSQISYAVFCLK